MAAHVEEHVRCLNERLVYGTSDEDNQITLKWLKSHDKKLGHFINNEWLLAPERGTTHVSKKSTGEVEITVSVISGVQEDVNDAVSAAYDSHKSWHGLSGFQRSRHLYRLACHVQNHQRLLINTVTFEREQLIGDVRDCEVPSILRDCYYCARKAQDGDFQLNDWTSRGVVAIIVSDRSTLYDITKAIFPAISVGNTVVVKPGHSTLLCSLLFAELCAEAGLPAGVVNVILGKDDISSNLASHLQVSSIFVHGHTKLVLEMRQASAGLGKSFEFEIENSPVMVVFESADLDSVTDQACHQYASLFVQESCSSALLLKLRDRMRKLRVGAATDNGVDVAAILDPQQHERANELLKRSLDHGAKVYEDCECELPAGCVRPTLITDAEPTSAFFSQKVGLPLVTVFTFRTAKEVICQINKLGVATSCSIWTENMALAMEVSQLLKCSNLTINCSSILTRCGKQDLLKFMQPFEEDCSALSGQVGDILKNFGNVEDAAAKVKKAVGSALKAAPIWQKCSTSTRANTLLTLANKLNECHDEMCGKMVALTGNSATDCEKEIELCSRLLLYWASMVDSLTGTLTDNLPGVSLRVGTTEALGVIGIICPDEHPLLAFVFLLAPALVFGNTIVIVPSRSYPQLALHFYQMFDALTASTVNVLTGNGNSICRSLLEHRDIDAMWYWGTADECTCVDRLAASTLRGVWLNWGRQQKWETASEYLGLQIIYKATRSKSICIPAGDIYAN